MDILKIEIERKRKAIEQLCGSTTKTASDGCADAGTVVDSCSAPAKRRYFKRSELHELERKEYAKRWEKNYDNTNSKELDKTEEVIKNRECCCYGSVASAVTSKRTISKTNRSHITNDELDLPSNNTEEPLDDGETKQPVRSLKRSNANSDISIDKAIQALRSLHEPIRLFGETNQDVIERLREIEVNEPKWRGQRNDFKEAMDQIDRKYLDELLNEQKGDSIEKKQISTTACKKIQIRYPDPGMSYKQLASIIKNRKDHVEILDSTLILSCFKIILKRWADHLNDRPDEQCRSVSGRIETALFHQTVSYLSPLFRKLKSDILATDIMDSLVDVVRSIFNRNYRKANEYFLELAIGNAPWPIGATNVGIHPRPGREKIASKHVAHVLNDETQRKYLQAVKRVITKAQNFYPGEAALSVEYHIDHED